MRTTFLVGRLTVKGEEIVVAEGVLPPPIPGPWTLRALIRLREDGLTPPISRPL
jgi:hypothetical protein